MKGLELNVTKQNGMTLVEYRLGTADVYDDRVADKVAPLGNIVPFQYKDEDGKRSVISYVHKDNSLEMMLKQTLKKADVLAILKGLLCAFEVGAAGVQICYLVRDTNYIYVDPESLAVKCLMVPVKQDPLGQSDIPDFFRNIVSRMRFDEADRDNYVARILTLINEDHYSNMKLRELVDAEMEKMNLLYTRDEGIKKDTSAIPETPNKEIKVNRVGVMNNMRPQGQPMPPMGQPMPPMGGQPMPPMGGQSMPPMGGQPMPPMGGQPKPPMGGQPMPPMGGQPMPPMGGQPKPPMGGQPMPPMGQAPQMPKPEAPKPQGMPVPPMPNGSLMGQLSGARPVPHLVRKATGEVINITKSEFILGKSKTKADYAIENNNAISREHCTIIQHDGVNYIKDNNSTNHTYVNGVELQPGKEVLLKHKTDIRMGDEEFVFLLRKGE